MTCKCVKGLCQEPDLLPHTDRCHRDERQAATHADALDLWLDLVGDRGNDRTCDFRRPRATDEQGYVVVPYRGDASRV